MIAIFGANGFIGRHLVARLSAAGCPVRAVSRRFDPAFTAAHAGVDFVEADFRDTLAMRASLEGVATVVQLVSSSSPGLGNQFLTEDIEQNVIPHVGFMRSAAALGVSKYVFVSSGGTVYGPDAPVPTPEDAHTAPINSHGMTKLILEKYMQMFARVEGLRGVTLRVSNPYGPGQIFRKGQGLIPALLQRVRAGDPVQIIGDGGAERDYLYISDLIDAMEAVVLRDIATDTLNIGSGQGATVLQVVEALEAALGLPVERQFLPDRPTDVRRSLLDISRAKTLLDWAPKVSLGDGIARTVTAQNRV